MFQNSLFFTSIVSLLCCCVARMPIGYSDHYARHVLCPLANLADHSNDSYVNEYLGNCFYNASYLTHVNKPCDMFNKDNSITCAGSVFVIHDEQAILLMFRWTVGNTEGIEEFDFYNMTLTFPGGGTVSEFYYNSFQVVWNNGMRDTFLAAKNSFPTYELWVTGVSMGASMAALAAPYISQMGYFAPKDIKMVNYGELRVGHKDFADRYPSLVPYAYRIVHRNDIMPHIIPLEAGYVHHQNEIWYNNLMHETDPWVECDAEESQNCSDSVPKSEWTKLDHVYFEHTCNC